MSQKYRSAAIGLGGNLESAAGGPADTLCAALAMLQDSGLRLMAVSRFYRTPAFPSGSGPDFVNACALMQTGLAADAVLAVLHAAEAAFGRRRDHRWGPRTLDLDLLFLDDLLLPDAAAWNAWAGLPPDRQAAEAPDRLILPHPRLSERPFVLIPLAEIAPGWRHPVSGQRVAEMAKALDPAQIAEVRPL
jgi:2-amino-4-hydroxy-6-hydroxymethyldihydropteridine diphosphokinase